MFSKVGFLIWIQFGKIENNYKYCASSMSTYLCMFDKTFNSYNSEIDIRLFDKV